AWGIEATVQQDGAEHRCERIGHDRRPVGAAALLLAFAEANLGTQVELSCESSEGVAIDEARARAREFAFGRLREALVQGERDDALEHGVADEFEPRAVACAVA